MCRKDASYCGNVYREAPYASAHSRTHPVFAVRTAGHVTGLKRIVGLSAFWNQLKRQSQPDFSCGGNFAQSDALLTPPYCCPHEYGPGNCFEHPSKMPTPPPGICRSKWLPPRSPPVLVTCTINSLPATGPEVNSNE